MLTPTKLRDASPLKKDWKVVFLQVEGLLHGCDLLPHTMSGTKHPQTHATNFNMFRSAFNENVEG